MILINNLKLPLDTDFTDLKSAVQKAINGNVISVKLYRKSVDARRKNDLHFCCSVLAEVKNEEKFLKTNKNASVYKKQEYSWLRCENKPEVRPVVVGFGPAGMFAGITLARAGLCPLIIERGSKVEERTVAVREFFAGGKLNPECNVQFGEGGAGTFSDGKLNTGIKNPKCRTVLEVLHLMGAPEKILTDAKPHIGTDILLDVVRNIRKEILSLGGEILFDTKLENINTLNGKITSIIVNGKEIPCDNLILATGHSARDTYRMLLGNDVDMVQKPFAVGVRIEHLQEDINRSLYGENYNHPNLGAADYKLACHLPNGRGVYTFCMCPGGEVINASSEELMTAVNGMSNSGRDGVNSNSALLVGVNPEDFGGDDVLAGCDFQEKIEKSAYNIGRGRVPVGTVGNFVFGEEFKISKVIPSVKPDYVYSDFTDIFPPFVLESLKQGILEFGKKIKGFDDPQAVLTAPETRSSAPVRITRNENFQSSSVLGLYPCGEGAGYAGGIVSAAVDGMTVAEEIISQVNKG